MSTRFVGREAPDQAAGPPGAPVVTVFGSSRCHEDAPCYTEARELGRLLGQAGYTIASGGYGGTMEAVSRGASEAGAYVIGVTCDVFSAYTPNRWLSEERRTADLLTRMSCLVEAGEALVAVMGGVGTLAEVSYVWNLLQIGVMTPRPFILLGGSWQPIVDAIRDNSHIGVSVASLVEIRRTPQEVLSRVLDFCPPDRAQPHSSSSVSESEDG